MSRIKVLTVSASGLNKREGISTVILDYYTGFDKNKFELDIVASSESHPLLLEKFKDIGVNPVSLPPRKKNLFMYVLALHKLIRRGKYDIFYIHGSSAIMAIELMVARMAGCKVRVVHSHSTSCEHKRADKLMRPFFYASYTDALACGINAGKWLYKNQKFEVVRNGRNVERYAYDENVRNRVREKLNVSDDALLVGHVGNFNKPKNQKYLIGVFQELLKQKSNARLYYMGTGPEEENVKALAIDAGIQDKVVFMGNIDNVPEMLQAMDVMAFPSMYEGLPLVVVEWQIAALPCLISDTVTRECAYTDLVHFISLEEDYKMWADEIINLSERNRNRIANEVKELTFKNGYDLQKNVEKLQTYFETRCGKNGRK